MDSRGDLNKEMNAWDKASDKDYDKFEKNNGAREKRNFKFKIEPPITKKEREIILWGLAITCLVGLVILNNKIDYAKDDKPFYDENGEFI